MTNEQVIKNLPFNQSIDFLFPAKPTKLETVSHFAIEGVMGNLDTTQNVISAKMMEAHESA